MTTITINLPDEVAAEIEAQHISQKQLDAFVVAIRDVVELAHSPGAFWSEALGLARRAFRS